MNNNETNNNEIIEEKANKKLQGWVKPTTLAYINQMNGSFAEKIQQLIAQHDDKLEGLKRLKISDAVESIDRQIQMMKNNIAKIEMDANAYIEGYNNDVENRINEILEQVVEQEQIKEQYVELQKEHIDLEKNHNEATIKVVELQGENNRLNDAKVELTNQNNQLLNREIQAMNKLEQISKESNNKIEQLKADINNKTITINTLETSVKLLEQSNEGYKYQVEQLKATMETSEANYKANIEQLQNNSKQSIKQFEDTINKLEKQAINTDKTNKETIAKLEATIEKNNIEYKANIDKLQAEHKASMDKLETINKVEIETKTNTINKLEQSIEILNADAKIMTETILKNNTSIVELKAKFELKCNENKELKATINTDKKLVEKLQKQITELETKYKLLEQSKADATAEGKNKAPKGK